MFMVKVVLSLGVGDVELDKFLYWGGVYGDIPWGCAGDGNPGILCSQKMHLRVVFGGT